MSESQKARIVFSIFAIVSLGVIGLSVFSNGTASAVGQVQGKATEQATSTTSEATQTTSSAPIEIPAGVYSTYAPNFLTTISNDQHVVLFFYSSVCTSCRSLDVYLKSNAQEIPANMLIVKVDLERDSQAAAEYQITQPHSLVTVDSNGTVLKQWEGSTSIAEIVRETGI